jgi:hypothetical protein
MVTDVCGVEVAQSVTVQLPMPHPPGYKPDPLDPSGRQVLDTNGHRVLNPIYQQQMNNSHINWCGVTVDLGMIAGSGISALGEVGAAAGGVVVAGSATVKETVCG